MANITPSDRQSAFLPMFEVFRTELDEHHDRRERIIKASRDITAASKKIIFALQRVRTLGRPISQATGKAMRPHIDVIVDSFKKVSRDLQGTNFYRYERNISSGMQEYFEALSFQYYLESQTIITLDQASSKLQSFAAEGDELRVTPTDYVLGLFDMTGELMRFAITTMATLGALPGAGSDSSLSAEETSSALAHDRHVLRDLQEMRARLETLDAGFSQHDRKLEVTRASVDKVEKALYGLVVRGSERPKGWVPDLSEGRERGAEGTEEY